MKIQSLTSILLRLVALYFLYTSVFGLVKVFIFMTTADSAAYFSSLLFISIEVIFPLLAFVFLWLFPNSVAKLIVKPSNNESIKPMSSLDWLRIILISMGVFITTKALFDTTYWFSVYQMSINDEAQVFLSEQKANIITTAVELIVGFILISKNTWIAQSLLKINAPERLQRGVDNMNDPAQ